MTIAYRYKTRMKQIATCGTPQDEAIVAAWYKVLNLFSDLGELEKMYLPPLVDPEAGLEAKVLVENRMAPSAASWAWH